MRGRGKSCAARPQEQGRHAVTTIRRAVTMKIEVKESKRANIAAMRKKLRQSVRGEELLRRKALDSTLVNRAIRVEPLQTCEVYSIHGRIRPLYRGRATFSTPHFLQDTSTKLAVFRVETYFLQGYSIFPIHSRCRKYAQY